MLRDEITELEQSIVELERQRPVLGKQVTDTATAAMRDKLNTLRAPERKGAALAPPDAVLGSEQLLTRFMPNELADKFRASPQGEGSSESGDLSGYAAEALAQQLMDAMRRYLSALSQRQPTVLVFEDLH